MFAFRATRGYRAELYVSLTIPAATPRLDVPCDALAIPRLPNGDYRMDVAVGYAVGDVDFAKDHGRRIIQDHPGWTAVIRRLNTGAIVATV